MLKKLLADEDNSEQKDDATKALIAPAKARWARPQRYQFKLKDSSLCPWVEPFFIDVYSAMHRNFFIRVLRDSTPRSTPLQEFLVGQ